MRRALTLLAILFLGSQAAQAVQFEGKWHGAGYTQEGTCPQFEIIVSVVEDKVQGEAVFPYQTYEIEGDLGKDGVFVGHVEYSPLPSRNSRATWVPLAGMGNGAPSKGPSALARLR